MLVLFSGIIGHKALCSLVDRRFHLPSLVPLRVFQKQHTSYAVIQRNNFDQCLVLQIKREVMFQDEIQRVRNRVRVKFPNPQFHQGCCEICNSRLQPFVPIHVEYEFIKERRKVGVSESQIYGFLCVHAFGTRIQFSRLITASNRPLDAPSSIPLISEATTVPGNDGLTQEERAVRAEAIFAPYHRRIAMALDARARDNRPTILIALHSFTPVYAGIARPWHIGTLYHRDRTLAPLLLQHLRAEGDLVVGDNEPYAVSDQTDYTIPVHGEMHGLVNTGIEVRQDLIGDQSGQRQWADRLARILKEIEETLRMEALI